MENKTSNGNGCLETKVENIMINKLHLIIGIIAFMVPIVGFFFKIQMDVALIKQNHEAHIETIMGKIKDIDSEILANKTEHKDIENKYENINSKLDQLIGKFER